MKNLPLQNRRFPIFPYPDTEKGDNRLEGLKMALKGILFFNEVN